MNFLIVTGLSGAGKSMAVNALEDIGFFCIDNIPVALLPRIVDFALQGENQLNRVAVVMDVRGVRSIEKLQEALADLDEKKIDYDILFLDANDAAIQRRYKETQSDGVCEELESCMSECPCPTCGGKRLRRESLAVTVGGLSISDYCEKSVVDALDFVDQLTLTEQQMRIGERILKEIKNRLGFLRSVGLEYLTLSRASATLSGGEAQRVKLATELARRSTGRTIYILDEPTTGLHFEDIRQLIDVLNKLVDRGNTVVVIEHNLDVVKVADWIIDIGPEGGAAGGRVLGAGPPHEVAAVEQSYTGRFLRQMGL